MGKFLITISWYGPYPKELKSEQTASGFSTAVGRALRIWRKANKGKKIKEIKLNVIKL